MNRFGEVLQDLMERRGLRSPEDLSKRLDEVGHDVPAGRVRAFMDGDEWVNGWFPGCVVEALDLDAEEMGALALAVAYGQAGYPP